MKKYRALRLISLSLLLASVVASASDVSVTLSIPKAEIRFGETPRFVVTIRAIADRVKVMKYATRSDLRDNFTRLVVLKNGKDVKVPIMISDPGPTDASDYIELLAGQTLTFDHDGAPLDLTQLQSGTYSASVKLWPDWESEPAISNTVTFRVRQP